MGLLLLLPLLLLTTTTTDVCFRLKDLPTHQQMLIACIVVQASCKDVTVASVVQAYTKACKCVPACVKTSRPLLCLLTAARQEREAAAADAG